MNILKNDSIQCHRKMTSLKLKFINTHLKHFTETKKQSRNQKVIAEAHPGPLQISKMERFAALFNGFLQSTSS